MMPCALRGIRPQMASWELVLNYLFFNVGEGSDCILVLEDLYFKIQLRGGC